MNFFQIFMIVSIPVWIFLVFAIIYFLYKYYLYLKTKKYKKETSPANLLQKSLQ